MSITILCLRPGSRTCVTALLALGYKAWPMHLFSWECPLKGKYCADYLFNIVSTISSSSVARLPSFWTSKSSKQSTTERWKQAANWQKSTDIMRRILDVPWVKESSNSTCGMSNQLIFMIGVCWKPKLPNMESGTLFFWLPCLLLLLLKFWATMRALRRIPAIFTLGESCLESSR